MTCPTITGDHAGRPTDYTPVVLASGQANAEVIQDGSSAALTCLHEAQVIAFERRFVRTTGGQPAEGVNHCLRADTNSGDGAPCVAFAQNSRDEVRLQNGDGQICGALAAEPGMKQQTYIAVQDVIHGDKTCNGKGWNEEGAAYTLDTMATQGVCFPLNGMTINKELIDRQTTGIGDNGDPCPTIRSQGHQHAVCETLHSGSTVRRLTPVEAERLMGFPDNWTRIPWRGKPAEDCPDGPRYKACGNSMGVNVMRWIGRRIQEVEDNQ